MAVNSGSGSWVARFTGRQLYVGGRIDGLSEEEVPTIYYIFAADSLVQVEGDWSKSEIHETFLPDSDGQFHELEDLFTARLDTGTASYRRRFRPGALRRLFDTNFSGAGSSVELRWFRDSLIDMEIQDARGYGGDVTYGIRLGGVVFESDGSGAYVGGTPPELLVNGFDAVNLVVERTHNHPLFPREDRVESFSQPLVQGLSVIGFPGSQRVLNYDDGAGWGQDPLERSIVDFELGQFVMSGVYQNDTQIRPFISVQNDPEPATVAVRWYAGPRLATDATLTAVDPAADQRPPEFGRPRTTHCRSAGVGRSNRYDSSSRTSARSVALPPTPVCIA